jgi:hypothetical protein
MTFELLDTHRRNRGLAWRKSVSMVVFFRSTLSPCSMLFSLKNHSVSWGSPR